MNWAIVSRSRWVLSAPRAVAAAATRPLLSRAFARACGSTSGTMSSIMRRVLVKVEVYSVRSHILFPSAFDRSCKQRQNTLCQDHEGWMVVIPSFSGAQHKPPSRRAHCRVHRRKEWHDPACQAQQILQCYSFPRGRGQITHLCFLSTLHFPVSKNSIICWNYKWIRYTWR